MVEELARTAILGQQAWQEAREKDDFPSFKPLLERTIALKRQQAECLGYADCPYDALLDEYEPEERTANVGRVLAGLREELVPLVAGLPERRRRPDTVDPGAARFRPTRRTGLPARQPPPSGSISTADGWT